MYCRFCGREIPDNSEFCSKCGKQLSVSGVDTKESSLEALVPDTQATVQDTSHEGLPINNLDLSNVVVSNFGYYQKEFEKISRGQSSKFNWAALFFGPFFCLYRRQGTLLKRFFLPFLIFLAGVPLVFALGMLIINIIGNTGLLIPWSLICLVAIIAVQVYGLICYIRCGRRFNQEYQVQCSQTDVPPKPKGTSLPKAILGFTTYHILIFMLSIICGLLLIWQFTNSSSKFESPESTMSYFVSCLQADDIDGALDAFISDEEIALISFANTQNESKIKLIGRGLLLPNEYPIYFAYNKANIRNSQLMSIANLIIGLLKFPNDVSVGGSSITFGEAYTGENMIHMLNPSTVLEDLTLLGMKIDPATATEESRQHCSEMNGTLDSAWYEIFYSYRDRFYIDYALFFKYDEGWKIRSMNGLPEEITEEEYRISLNS